MAVFENSTNQVGGRDSWKNARLPLKVKQLENQSYMLALIDKLMWPDDQQHFKQRKQF